MDVHTESVGQRRLSRRRRRGFTWWSLFVFSNLFVVTTFFLALEGLLGTLRVIEPVLADEKVAERSHTVYDAELGWINKPDSSVRDLYGPGLDFSTNAQGFRGKQDVTAEIPPGKLRLICSGDSFTLGYGVSDEYSWCARLPVLDPRLETINMGQGGYGLGQIYLWYEREKINFDHDVHLLAFISHDFRRMGDEVFLGYPKPVLQLQGDDLVASNVPVPRVSEWRAWTLRNRPALQQFQLLKFIRDKFPAEPARSVNNAEVMAVATRIFQKLQAFHRKNGSLLVLVYLPSFADYFTQNNTWRQYLASTTAENHLRYLDLTDDLRTVATRHEAIDLFIRPGEVEYSGAEGHYSVAGNRFVAESILRRLKGFPEFAERLEATVGSR